MQPVDPYPSLAGFALTVSSDWREPMNWRMAIIVIGIALAVAGIGVGLAGFDAHQDGNSRACGAPFTAKPMDATQQGDAGRPTLEWICQNKLRSRREVALNLLLVGGASTAVGIVVAKRKKGVDLSG